MNLMKSQGRNCNHARVKRVRIPDCLDFVFHCNEGIRLDKLYLFYRELAKARIYVDILYWGSSYAKLIESQGYKGSEAVRAVTTRLGPSIRYHISTSGRIRLDGKMDQKEVLAAMLRRVFPPVDGSPLKSNASAVQRHLVDGRQLQDWIAQRHGKCLRIESSCMFDGFGVQGLWDKLLVSVPAGLRRAVGRESHALISWNSGIKGWCLWDRWPGKTRRSAADLDAGGKGM
eukprot:s2122_g9.t1